MFSIRDSRCFVAVMLGLAATAAGAGGSTPPPAPKPVAFDGRYYEVVLTSKITWDAAKAAAEKRTFQGLEGHLATIGSAEEDAFVDQLRRQVLGTSKSAGELWVGGFQVKCATSKPEPACGWLWTNGETISPANTVVPYTNWQKSEPDNLIRKGVGENHLAIGLNGVSGWNDQGDVSVIRGYVIEYGEKFTVPAASCTSDGKGCNPTGAQVLQLPDEAKLQTDATLTATVTRFHDDPNRCGRESLTLFDGAVVIPPYLCGHPDFIVIETHTEGVEVLNGAVEVENLTDEVLPGNLYGCTSVRQNPAGVVDPDPSHRDVVAWQAQDKRQMLETANGAGRYLGTIAEVTDACGSSRGKVVSGSYHFVGLRIHPGPGNELTDGNPQGNFASFTELTRYKLKLLRVSVDRSQLALSPATYQQLRGFLDRALSFHDNGNYASARLEMERFLDAVEHADYAAIPGKNFSGEHLMRGSNVEFMYREKIIPFAH